MAEIAEQPAKPSLPLDAVGQRPHRGAEQRVRRKAVAFARWTARQGLRHPRAAARLGLRPGTLGRWHRSWNTQQLSACLRGRPRPPLAPLTRLEVTQVLEDLGPRVGLPALRALFPKVPRSRLRELKTAFRHQWHQDNQIPTEQLTWTRPGRVWAADFTDAPTPVDGLYGHVLALRDLASHRRLLALPTPTLDTQEALQAIEADFLQYGAPLVFKSDNGGAFTSKKAQDLFQHYGVTPLLSPPHTPRYNGSAEAGIGSLKTGTHHEAASHGRPGCWTSDDLEAVRSQGNHHTRPWGSNGPSPEEAWLARTPIRPEERQAFQAAVKDMETRVRAELGLDPEAELGARARAIVARAAISRALQKLGYLLVRRKRISPPFNSPLRAKIT
jgi:transposase InsO family protein